MDSTKKEGRAPVESTAANACSSSDYSSSSALAEFRDAMTAAGLAFDGEIIADGALHRAKVNGDRNPNSFYTLHLDGMPAGIFGCWKRGIKEAWCAVSTDKLTEAERADRDRLWKQQQAERDADRQRQQNEAAAAAAAILAAAQPAPADHPYLLRKAVKPYPGVMMGGWPQRQRDNCLLIPLRTADGLLATVQAIFPAPAALGGRDKDFLKGGAKAGAHFVIGDLHTADTVIIAEGYATAATLHESTGYAAVMAVDAGNLRPVAEILKKLHLKKRFIIAADNDRKEDGSNPGVKAATAAAKAVKGIVAIPSFNSPLEDDIPGTDFNDLAALRGLEAVREQIENAVQFAKGTGQVRAEKTPATAAAGAGGLPRLAEALHDDAVTMAKDYCKSHAGTWWIKSKDDCEEFVFLANFTAEIVAETTLDDGAERRRRLEITGAINGRPLPTASVASGDFAALGWVGEQFGSAAHIAPGHGLRDRLRYAIQVLSTATQHRTVYQHTGWREIAGQWLYLTPTAVIGAAGAVDGIDVDLPGTLADYALRPGAGEAADAARASLGMLACAPASIAVPLFLAPYRAMLGEALPGDFSLFLSGVTGSRKTELAAICQAHFGDAWHGKRLPAAWSSTPNSLERAAFLAKDAVMVVDDFCPTGTTTDIARFHTGADRLLRAQGNRAGRQRMNADGSLRPAYYPRGLIVATGEDIPRGQSLRGRLLILEFDSHTVDLSALSTMQNHAATGRLAAAAGAFAQWLAPRMGELKKTLPVLRNQLRNEITATAHSRHPDTLAGLVLTAQLFAQFAAEHGITLPAEWQTNITNALLQAGADQQQAVASEEPAGRFVRLIHSALSAGLCHVRRRDGLEPSAFEDMKAVGWQLRQFGSGEHAHDEWIPQGPCIGWFDESGLYLDPDAAYRSTARYASDQGQALPLTPRALFKALDNKGHLRTKNPGRTTVKQRFGDGTTKNVLHLHPIPMRNCGNNGNSGNNDTKAADSYEENVFPQTGTASGTTGTTGTGTGTDPVGGDAENDACSRFVPAVPAMFPQAFCEREQKNARNSMIDNDISQPVPDVPDVPANAHIPPNKFDGVNIPSGWEKF